MSSNVRPVLLRVSASAAMLEDTAERWDAIALTEAEKQVLDVFRSFADVNGVTFVADPRMQQERVAMARVAEMDRPVPLASLGRAVHLFQIAVAMQSARLADHSARRPPPRAERFSRIAGRRDRRWHPLYFSRRSLAIHLQSSSRTGRSSLRHHALVGLCERVSNRCCRRRGERRHSSCGLRPARARSVPSPSGNRNLPL